MELKTYIGVKRVQAMPAEKDEKPGYKVVYPDGYESWSPKDEFERAYFRIQRPDKLSLDDIDRFIDSTTIQKLNPKTALVGAKMINGFLDYETSSCVDPKNYDKAVGYEIGMERIKNRLWKMLGFVLQWADHGLVKGE